MKTLGIFALGFATGVGVVMLAASKIGEEIIEEEEELYKMMNNGELETCECHEEDHDKFNDCGYGCECECHEEHTEEEVLINEDDRLVEHYFTHSEECECDAFGQQVEKCIIEHTENMTVKDLTPEGKAKLETLLGFELDENVELDDTGLDMLRMCLEEQANK